MTEEDIVIVVKYLKVVGKYVNWLLSTIAGEFESYPRLRLSTFSYTALLINGYASSLFFLSCT